MAEDGMLLNFELPSDAFDIPRKFKGGSWKDRLTARKSAEYGRRKAKETREQTRTPNYGEVQSEDEEFVRPEQPVKRMKLAHVEQERPAVSHSAPKRSGSIRESHALPRSTNGEVISSLFTYNPAPNTTQTNLAEDIAVEPTNAPLLDPALASFTNLGLSSMLANHLLKKFDIRSPTAIQRRAIEQLCAHNVDAFVQAETGSGKTLAYLLPIVQRISEISLAMKAAGQDFSRESGLFAIVLAPTRELSKQIYTVLEGLLNCCHWIVGGIVIGGEKKKSEKARMRKGINVLVATPGRLADHVNNTEVLDVSRVRWLVLDEGDRLMELGFEQDIQKILGNLNIMGRRTVQPLAGLPERRTTVLCSATIKSDVDKLRGIALKDAVTLAIDPAEKATLGESSEEKAFSAPAQLKQSYAVVPGKQRLATLAAVLKQSFKRKGSVSKCIVFMSCADSVDFHFEALSQVSVGGVKPSDSGVNADEAADWQKGPLAGSGVKLSKSDKIPQGQTIAEARTESFAGFVSPSENKVHLFRLHGSLQQSTRTSTLKAFTQCDGPSVLVCTDVASRGLDVPDVDLVIEYDPPFSKDDHLHRVGRTARAGRDGRAMIFLQPGCEEGYVEVLKEGRPRNLTRHEANELLKKGFAPSSGVVNAKSWEDAATEWQLDLERWVLDNPKHLEQARRAFQSHIRAYATHVATERAIFDMKQLHLGHLAKAFALRDKPGAIRVPGMRPGLEEGKKSKDARKANAGRKGSGKKSTRESDFDTDAVDEREARRKMMAKMRGMGGVNEFNLG